MVDEFDQIEQRGRNRWVAAIFINLLIWGLAALVVYSYLTRKPIVEIKGIVASRIYEIGARQDGRIGTIHVEETDSFTTGDLLFDIEDRKLLTQIEKTSETLKRIQQEIAEEKSERARQLREHSLTLNIGSVQQEIGATSISIENLLDDLDFADAEIERQQKIYTRAEDLFNTGVLTRSEVEAVYAKVMEVKAAKGKILNEIDLKRQQNRYNQRRLDDYEEYRRNLEKSTADAIKDLERELGNEGRTQAGQIVLLQELEYKADRSGLVAERLKQDGEQVQMGEVILRVTTGEELWVEAYFKPEDEYLVQAGDPVKIRYGSRLFDGVVRTKEYTLRPFPGAPVSALVSQSQYVVVPIDFEDIQNARDANLRPGLLVIVEVNREEGLLYRLGIKKRRHNNPVSAAATPRDKPTTSTAD